MGYIPIQSFTLLKKNLPAVVLAELNSLSVVLEKLSDLVASVHIVRENSTVENLEQLRIKVNLINTDIEALRNNYILDNVVDDPSMHGIVAPAMAQIKIWLTENASVNKPGSHITLNNIETRITDVYLQATIVKSNSMVKAQEILDNQRNRFEIFLSGVNLLFVLIVVILCCLMYLFIRQILLRKAEFTTKHKLQEQKDLLQNLLQNLPSGVTVWDQAKNIVHLNKSFSDMTGCDRNDIPHLRKPQSKSPF